MKAKKNAESTKTTTEKALKKLAEAMRQIKFANPNNGRTRFHFASQINREIIPSQVTKLSESINKMGVVRPLVCAEIDFLGSEKTLTVIDGQHLLLACMRSNVEIPYITIKIENKQELVEMISLLNASSKSWCTLDYIKAWSALIPDYEDLKKIYNIYDFDMGIVAGILMGSVPSGSNNNVGRKVKKGLFRIIDKDGAIKTLDYMTDVFRIIPRMNRFENRYFCAEYVKFINATKKYDHKRFLTNLEKEKKKLLYVTQEENGLVDFFRHLI